MKQTFYKLGMLCSLGITVLSNAQEGKVGINTERPKATLDIKAKTGDQSTNAEGILIPRISREKAAKMSNPTTNTEVSTLVYINDITVPQEDTAKTTSEVTDVGFYYFDGNKWKWIRTEQRQGNPNTNPNVEVKNLEYAVNNFVLNADTPQTSETCLGHLCVRVNDTRSNFGVVNNNRSAEVQIQYRLINNIWERINVWGEKIGNGLPDRNNVKYTSIRSVIPSDGWQDLEIKPNAAQPDMARYILTMSGVAEYSYGGQVYRINVAINPKYEESTNGVRKTSNAGMTIFIERLSK